MSYEKLTFEAVAKRCQTSKTSLYRRWSSKREMVLASIKDGPAQHSSAPFSLGMSLRDDLLALMNRLKHTLTESNANTAFMLLSAGLEDPELCDAIEQTMGPTGARLPREVIDEAIRRGELSEEAIHSHTKKWSAPLFSFDMRTDSLSITSTLRHLSMVLSSLP